MKKYLLPSALILLLGLGAGFAQTINSALQQSQDATGAFAIDTNLGVYFPGHILSPTKGRVLPTVFAGSTTATLVGTDTAGTVTMGTSAISAAVTFGTAYISVPTCAVTWQTGGASTITPISYTPGTTGIIFSQGTATGNKINYICMSQS